MNNQLLELIKEKGSTSIDVFNRTKDVFDKIRVALQEYETHLRSALMPIDARISINYEDKGKLEAHFNVANDVMVFLMQTHVFNFDASHSIHRSSYAKEDSTRTQCGMICIYDFLVDSFRYNRLSDNGFLIARIFINKDGHYFVEGKKQLDILFNNFESDEINNENIKAIIETALSFVLDNELLVPGFDLMQITNVEDLANRSGAGFDKGKGFGFQMHNEKKTVS